MVESRGWIIYRATFPGRGGGAASLNAPVWRLLQVHSASRIPARGAEKVAIDGRRPLACDLSVIEIRSCRAREISCILRGSDSSNIGITSTFSAIIRQFDGGNLLSYPFSSHSLLPQFECYEAKVRPLDRYTQLEKISNCDNTQAMMLLVASPSNMTWTVVVEEDDSSRAPDCAGGPCNVESAHSLLRNQRALGSGSWRGRHRLFPPGQSCFAAFRHLK